MTFSVISTKCNTIEYLYELGAGVVVLLMKQNGIFDEFLHI